MDNEPVHSLEQPFAQLPQPKAPAKLRGPVLAAMHRELAAQRWERRFGQIAIALVIIGVGLNVIVGVRGVSIMRYGGELAMKPQAIVDVATAVAKATDAETGSRFAQHLAALSGTTLTKDQAAAIQQAIKPQLRNSGAGQDKG
ncbi:MAG TPA: hypothetical protein VGJ15_08380 [Pirellulales bacterium]|jgi:hypothetical protein